MRIILSRSLDQFWSVYAVMETILLLGLVGDMEKGGTPTSFLLALCLTITTALMTILWVVFVDFITHYIAPKVALFPARLKFKKESAHES